MTLGIYLLKCNVQPTSSKWYLFLMELINKVCIEKQLVSPGNLKWSIKVLIEVCVVSIATCKDTHSSTKI